MANSTLKLACVLAVTTTLVGCGYAVNPYGASVQNVTAIKGSGIRSVSVAPFTATNPGQKSIMCRAAGPVETPNGVSFESYIQTALVDELKLAGVYDEKSPTKLTGKVEEVDFNSNIGAGKWVMSLTIANGHNPGYTTRTTHEFSTNWVADKACQQVAQAFGPAVQKLVYETVTNPKFATLAK